MPALKIDLYSDIICPWCIIGQHRLDKVLSERFCGLDIDIEHHPYELMPQAPPEGLRLEDYFRQKGISDAKAAFARPEGEARASGLHLELSRQPFVYRTVRAHTLLRAARNRGTQHVLSTALMAAFFHEQRNISDHNTLVDIASRHGFSPEEADAILRSGAEQTLTENEIRKARVSGITSVPTFRIGTVTIVGGRTEDEIASAIHEELRLTRGSSIPRAGTL